VDTRSPQLQLALVFPEVGCFQYQFNAGEVMPPSSRSTASSIAAESSTSIIYRAVHVRTAWRRAFNHKTLELALHGINGAAGLFAGRVRIDYIMHGGAEGRSRMGGPSNRICRAACIRIWRDLDRARPIDELPSSMNILPKAERRS
jgi:hypothetical protein